MEWKRKMQHQKRRHSPSPQMHAIPSYVHMDLQTFHLASVVGQMGVREVNFVCLFNGFRDASSSIQGQLCHAHASAAGLQRV